VTARLPEAAVGNEGSEAGFIGNRDGKLDSDLSIVSIAHEHPKKEMPLLT
jgi:hypothetical protein